ncbi:MAG: hypothetical protein ACM3SY_18570 [Candidatus Omnitrophota bacterium]
MMMTDKKAKETVMAFVFWGSLWGMAEATLGYAAHMASILPGVAGLVMFPIGFYFMLRTLRSTGKFGAVFAAAVIAAGIKLLDFFLPGPGAIYILNPALCIILEALAVIAVYRIVGQRQERRDFRFSDALAVGTGWRLVFLGYLVFLSLFSIRSPLLGSGWGGIARFLVLESIVNAAIMALGLNLSKVLPSFGFNDRLRIRPMHAVSALAVAILLKLAFL